MTEQFFDKELAARKIEAIPGLMEYQKVCVYICKELERH